MNYLRAKARRRRLSESAEVTEAATVRHQAEVRRARKLVAAAAFVPASRADRCLPKRGFTNIFAKKYTSINVEDLNKFDNGTEVTAELLKESGVIKKINDGIVILGRGDLEKKLTIKAKRFSKSAEEKINAAGGKAEVI